MLINECIFVNRNSDDDDESLYVSHSLLCIFLGIIKTAAVTMCQGNDDEIESEYSFFGE